VYSLGDRILKKGKHGADVTQLKNILIDKEFLEKPFVKGDVSFDVEIERALKRFQDSIGIEATGEVDTQTLYFLKK
ncbi:MAG: peptidoglycan-binding protein, partial [Alistipes sp.]|nr:peptidoglycan-binding protein [Alistipes sp.]